MSRQYGILVDIAACIGCNVCMVACKQINNLDPSSTDVPGSEYWINWIRILEIGPNGIYPDIQMFYLPILCQHCANPVCVEACPTDAISKLKDGVVYIDKNKCNGCKNNPDNLAKCIDACPFRAFQINPKTHKAEGCTLCLPHVSQGLEPACVRACPGACLTFGDLNDSESLISKKLKDAGDRSFTLKPEKGTRPSIWYIRPKGVNIAQFASVDVLVSG